MPTPDILINTKARDFLTGEFKKIRSELKKTSKQGKKDFTEINKAAKTFNKTVTAGKALLAGFISIKAARALGNQITTVADLGEEYGLLSKQLGVSTEFLSEVGYAAELQQIKFTEFSTMVQRINRRFGDFAQGTGEAAKGLAVLGDDLADAVRGGANLEVLLPKLADRFKELGDDQKRLFTIFKLADTDGVKLLRLLNDGSDAIKQYREEARQLGLSFDKDAIAKTSQFNRELRKLEASFRGIRNEVVLEFLPPLTEALGETVSFIKENRGEIAGFLKDVGSNALNISKGVLVTLDSAIAVAERFDRFQKDGLFSAFRRAIFPPIFDDLPSKLGPERSAISETRELLDSIIGKINDWQVAQEEAAKANPISPEVRTRADALRGSVEDLNDAIGRFNSFDPLHPFGPRIEATFADRMASIEQAREANQVRTQLLEDFHSRQSALFQEGSKQLHQQIEDAKELARIDPLAGLQAGLRESADAARQLGEQVRVAYHQVEESIAGSATNEIIAFAQRTKDAEEAFHAFARSVLADLTRIALRAALTNAISGIGSLFSGGGGASAGAGAGASAGASAGVAAGAAKGGVFGGHFRPVSGHLAGGGVVRRRGLYELAEAGGFEAVVPMPDNRHIPLKVVGPRQPAPAARQAELPPVVIHIHEINGVSNRREAEDVGDVIRAEVLRALKESWVFNQELQGR